MNFRNIGKVKVNGANWEVHWDEKKGDIKVKCGWTEKRLNYTANSSGDAMSMAETFLRENK